MQRDFFHGLLILAPDKRDLGTVLRGLAQPVVHQYKREHGFGNRRRAQADTRVVTASGRDFYLLAACRLRGALLGDARGRLEGHARDDWLSRGDAAEDATSSVALKALFVHLVAVLGADHGGDSEAFSDLNALDGIDAHQRARDLRVKLVENRLPEASGHAFGHDGHARTGAVSCLAQFIDQLGDRFYEVRVWAEEVV